MKEDFIPVNEPLFNGREKDYLIECIDTGWISSEGPFVKRFEEKMAQMVGRKHGIAVTNGTTALDASVEALGIGSGDEIIMPSFTITSCINQIVRSGAVPILIDADPLTWNIDVHTIEERISSKTKAIMVVHIYGLPVDMDPVLELCESYNLKLIEDAAEMIGQTYKGNQCGSFGDISTFSFYPNKHITTGEGGMILTDDDDLAETCRSLRNLCFQPKKRFVHERLGWNMRMTNLQAAVGLAQLEQLDEFVSKKRKMGTMYNELLNNLGDVQLPLSSTEYAENIYWVYGLVIDDSLAMNAEDAMKKLADSGIGTRPFFYPMHMQPVLKKMGFFFNENHPVSEKIAEKGFYIPSGMALNNDQILRVANVIHDIFK